MSKIRGRSRFIFILEKNVPTLAARAQESGRFVEKYLEN